MEKRTLFALVLVAVFGIGAYAVLRAPQKGEHRGPAPRPFPVLKAADVTSFEVTSQKGEKTTLTKKGSEWRITAPIDAPADAQAMKTLTDAVDKMTFGDVVTENATKHEDLGVADKDAVRLKIITATQSPEMILGKTVAGSTMLRLPGKNEVWQVSGLVQYQVNKSPKDWRDHVIVPIVAADVDKLTVEVPGGSRLVVERVAAEPPHDGDAAAKKPATTRWKVVEATGDAPKPTDVLDESQPTTVAQALQSLRASDVVEGKSAKDAGLEPAQLTITASAGGKAQVLEIGARQGEDVFVRHGGDPTIFLAKRYLLERALARPVDYRDKTLVHLKADEIAHVRVTQGKDVTDLSQKDGKWTLVGGPLDDAKAKALVGGLEALYGSSFVTDKAVKTELDKPRATILVEPKSGAEIAIKVGGVAPDGGDYYVVRDGSKDVLVAKKFAVDRLLKKIADLAPSAKPPAPAPHPGMPPGMQMPHGARPPHP